MCIIRHMLHPSPWTLLHLQPQPRSISLAAVSPPLPVGILMGPGRSATVRTLHHGASCLAEVKSIGSEDPYLQLCLQPRQIARGLGRMQL